MRITYFRSLSAAGFAATAISYGPGRMGFGLFVPEFRSVFSMSSSTVGLVSSLGFEGFFAGLLIAQFFLNRRGPEFPVLTGLAAATIGLGIVALAPGITVLTAGIFIASSSAGFAWTPFNDAVSRKVRDGDRPTALSVISTGTAVGIALAGAVALGMGADRLRLADLLGNLRRGGRADVRGELAALRHVEKSPEDLPDQAWRELLHPWAAPLFAVSFVFGLTSAVYISFAADRFAEADVPGMPDGATAPLVFIVYGLFGLAGLLTGRARDAIGLTWLLRALLIAAAASLILAALLPGSWGGLIASAGLQGVNVMMTSAVLAFWSERLFPSLPSLGFTATVLALAAGNVIGPALAGAALDGIGTGTMFCATAVIPLAATAILRTKFVVERPTGTSA